MSLALHPATAFAGSYAIAAWHLQGFSLWGRTKMPMATEALVQKNTITPRMVMRAMRNLVIGIVVFLVVGNVTIFAAFQLLARSSAAHPLPTLPSIENLTWVSEELWRGSAPDANGYASLAESGVKTIVDLRAEDLRVDEELIESLGMQLVRIPLRDGQSPTESQVGAFLDTMRDRPGLVYLHCGAGVGRTGTMAAAYLVETGRASSLEAVQRNLAVGPPSLEQIAFAAGLEEGEIRETNPAITLFSRILDAPRRILVRVRHSYN